MAKDLAHEDDDDKFDRMDAESLEFLDQVRKGKSRNYVLSVKGSKVRSLLVKKKPLKDKEKKAARGEGYQPVWGVVSGKGAKLTFHVARSDGFEDVPGRGKIDKLKKFLVAQTGKPFKPSYEFVIESPPIPFDAEDLNHPLIARFMALEPQINAAVEANPEQTPKIKELVSEIRQLLQDDETVQTAGPRIDELETLLQSVVGTGVEKQRAAKLAQALKKLKPLLDKARNEHPQRAGELVATVTQIAGEIQGGQLDTAKQNIMTLGTLLKSLLATPTGEQPSDALAKRWNQRETELEPRLLEAQRSDREKATALGNVWTYAVGQADAGNYANAFKALDRLEDKINEVLSSASAKGSDPVSDESDRFRTLYEQLLNTVPSDLQRLRSSDPVVAEKIQKVVDAAAGHAAAGDFQRAFTFLDKGTEALAKALGAARAAESTEVIPEGIVAEIRQQLDTAVDRWNEAATHARDSMKRVKDALDTELPDASQSLNRIVDSYWGELLSAFDSVRSQASTPAELPQLMKKINTLNSEVSSDDVLTYLEDCGFPVKSVFQNAFSDLTTILAVSENRA